MENTYFNEKFKKITKSSGIQFPSRKTPELNEIKRKSSSPARHSSLSKHDYTDTLEFNSAQKRYYEENRKRKLQSCIFDPPDHTMALVREKAAYR